MYIYKSNRKYHITKIIRIKNSTTEKNQFKINVNNLIKNLTGNNMRIGFINSQINKINESFFQKSSFEQYFLPFSWY